MKKEPSKQKREQIEAQFDTYMNRAIKNYARNVIRKTLREEGSMETISLDTIEEDSISKYISVTDTYHNEEGITIETDLKIKITDNHMKDLLAGLTEREKQVVVLKAVCDLDYDEIGKVLNITPDRAKAYKYYAVKKARAEAGRQAGGQKGKI